MDNHSYHNENLEESEFGQLQAMHLNMNALAAVQRQLAEQAQNASAEFCEDCGEPIPEARRLAIPGVQLCVHCKSHRERKTT